MVRPVSFVPNPDTYVFPIVLNNIVPSEGLEIIINRPVLVPAYKENGLNNIFEA